MSHNPLPLQLYERHRDALVTYAGRIGGDTANAEDIVQDAWLQLDRHPEPQSLREPIAYLKRIVRNLVIDRARRRRYENIQDDALKIAARTIADDTAAQDQQIDAQDEMQAVMHAIEAMPQRQRIAMKMYHFEGRKLREIALHLGISKSLAHILVKQGLEDCDRAREARKGL